MGKKLFLGSKFKSLKADGSVNASGTAEFWEPDGAFSTYKSTYTDSTLGTANSNTITLDANGEADVFLNGDYDVTIKDSAGTTLDTAEKINPDASVASGNFNIIINPSLETDEDSNNFPDSWDFTEFSSSTNAIDTTTQTKGTNSMKFTSGGAGGAKMQSSDFFEIQAGNNLNWSFDMKVDDAGLRILAQVLWYTAAKVALGSPSTDIHDDSTTNPTSWTSINGVVAVPATAYYGKFLFWGAHSSDVTTGSVWIDNIVFTNVENVEIIKGSDVASAAALDPTGKGNVFDVTGTTTITSIASSAPSPLVLQFDGILTLTHHATNLILPAAANFTTAAGDIGVFIQYGSGTWYCMVWTPADGVSLVNKAIVIGDIPTGGKLELQTEIATTSGTTQDYTGISSDVKKITFMVAGVSTNGTSLIIIQLGDSGGFETSGYLGTAGYDGGQAAHNTGFIISTTQAVDTVLEGSLVLTLEDATNNTWIINGSAARSNDTLVNSIAGRYSLSGALTQVRLTMVNGTDAFDAGAINIILE